MIAEWGEQFPVFGFEPQFVCVAKWQMAVDAVINNSFANLAGHSTLGHIMTLEASLREQPHVASLQLMGIMTIRTRHLGFLETLAVRQSIELIAGMHAVFVEVSLGHFEMIADSVAGPKRERRCFPRGGSGMALPANIQLLLPC